MRALWGGFNIQRKKDRLFSPERRLLTYLNSVKILQRKSREICLTMQESGTGLETKRKYCFRQYLIKKWNILPEKAPAV